ncbi:MAG: putative Ig domain-containing protein, partial [Sphaerospermopsis kisseleviana]
MLVAQGNGGTNLGYQFRLVTPDLITNSLTLGSQVSGIIAEAGEQDTYTFTGSIGQKLFFDALVGNSNIKTRLYAPSGVLILDKDTNADWGAFNLGEAGIYRLVIDANGETTGNYSFVLSDRRQAPVITLSNAITGQLEQGNQVKLYQINGKAGQQLNFDLTANQWSGANWILYNPSGGIVKAPDLSNPDFTVILSSTDIYTLAIIGNSSDPVDYSFQITDITPTSVTTTGLNIVQSGTLNSGQIVDYNFTANAGTLLLFDAQNPDPSNWQIRTRLYNPDGSLVIDNQDARYDQFISLEQTGNYKVQIYGYYESTSGDYQFNLLEVPKTLASRNTNYLEIGGTTTGTLNYATTKLYTFSGIAGQRIFFNSLYGDGINVNLYDPNGAQIYTTSGNLAWSNDSSPFTLTQNGLYQVLVQNNSGGQQNYAFQVLDSANAPEITYSLPITGSINNGQQSQIFKLQATAGETLYFDNLGWSASNQPWWYYQYYYHWKLFGAGNNQLFDNYQNTDTEIVIPETGDYYLLLQGGPDGSKVDYNFRVTRIGAKPTDILTPGAGETANNNPDQLGFFPVKIGVKDTQGGTAIQDYQIRLWADPENSNPVIISEPEKRFALDTKAYRYQLKAIDGDGDPLVYRLLDAPVGAFINNTSGELLWFSDATVQAGSQATFTVEVNDRRGGWDRQTFTVDVFGQLGTIRGGVFDDLNGNGFRDTKLIQGDNPAVIFTIDVSGSTAAPFRGKGEYEDIKTVVDAQVAAAQVLLDAIIAQGAGDRVKIGLIIFGSDALIQDLDPTTAGLQEYTTAIADADYDGVYDIRQILKSLTPGMIQGGTDIHTALDKIDALFDVLPGDPNFIFMSDGYDDEFDKNRAKATIDDLKSKGGNITAFAIGEAATTENLEAIDPNAIQVIDFDELYNIFFGFDDRYALEPWKQGVTVYLDLNNNQVLDTEEPFRITKDDQTFNTLGNIKYYYTFDNLIPGNYTVRVEVPNGSNLTAPPANQLPIIDTVTLQGETFSHLFGLSKIAEPPNQSPIFLSTPPNNLQLRAGEVLKYDANARDANGDPLTYQLTFAPEGMTIDSESGIVVWIPTKQQVEKAYQELQQINQAAIIRGRYDLVLPHPLFNVLVTAKDGRGGSALQYLTFELLSDNHAPLFTSLVPDNAKAQSGKTFQFQATAIDADNDTLTYSFNNSTPNGMTIDATTGLVTWTPDDTQLGANQFTVKVEDGKGGQAFQTVTLTVNAADNNQAPIFTSTPRTTTRIGSSYFYQVEATDPNGDALTYSLVKAPTGMTLEKGLISWQPTAAQAGQQTVTIQASDGTLTTEQTYQITVSHQASNRAPVITSAPNLTTNIEQIYTYNLTGQDPDGDLVFWSLDQAPSGMVLDIQTGALRWQPQSNQLGQQQVTVRLLDSYGDYSTQTFTLKVNGANSPANILSNPITRGAIGQAYTYTVVAVDPENSPLTYSLGRRPNGMTIDATGKVQWTPTQVGSYDIDVSVTDNQGATTTQTYRLEVGSTAINHAPNITSTPGFVANVGSAYQYQVEAKDPDGQTLRYQLLESPQGMTIDAASGLLSWTTPVNGNYQVVVAVFDPDGLGVTQGYTLTAKTNSLPVIRSTPGLEAVPNQIYRYNLQAFDPDGDSLGYSLDTTSQALGMTLDTQGRLSWTPNNSQLGDHAVILTVTDGAGGTTQQTFTLKVTADTTAPQVRINRSLSLINQGETVSFQVVATDNIGIANLQLLINDTPVVIDSNGVASFTATTTGVITAKAVALDAAGNRAEATTTVNVLDPTDTEAPTVNLDLSGIVNGEITAPVEIKGSVNDTNLDYYALEVAPADGSQPFKEMFRGTSRVNNGVLGVLDPTLLPNDTYQVRLVAYDVNGAGNSVSQLLDVKGDLKLGNFQLSFTDLEIPVSGIPITLTRTYDTLISNSQQDFGYGWRMEFRNASVRTSLPKDELYQELGLRSVGFKEGDSVYITLPGGKRERFTFKLQEMKVMGIPLSAVLGRSTLYKPTFVADKGSTSTLSVDTAGIVLIKGDSDRVIPFSGGSAYSYYNPQDWGNTYKLTTKEGVVYNIDATTGDINTITNRNGDVLNFSDGGIVSSNGQQVTFERDAQGRIVAAIDPMGNRVSYQYDANGDLVKVTDRENNTTTFEYNGQQAHYLDKII